MGGISPKMCSDPDQLAQVILLATIVPAFSSVILYDIIGKRFSRFCEDHLNTKNQHKDSEFM